MAELACVAPGDVDLWWPQVSALLQRAVSRTGLAAFTDIEREIRRGDALLWLAVVEGGIAAAASTRLERTEAGLVCVVVTCAGEGITNWLPLLEGIEDHARAEGCSRMRIFGRRGWQRLLRGYRPAGVILDKTLRALDVPAG